MFEKPTGLFLRESQILSTTSWRTKLGKVILLVRPCEGATEVSTEGRRQHSHWQLT